MAKSENGFEAIPTWGDSRLTQIKAGGVKFRVRRGNVADIFTWLIEEFVERVEPIDEGELDDWGWAFRQVRGGRKLSNHASGTAIDLNSREHWIGTRNTFRPDQVKTIHAILAESKSTIRWGGNYKGRPDDMHWEIRPGVTLRQIGEALDALGRCELGMRQLWLDSVGPDVEFVQKAIGVARVDGWFGATTEGVVERWQESKGLKADGIIGRRGWEALGAVVPAPVPAPVPRPVRPVPAPVRVVDPAPKKKAPPPPPAPVPVQPEKPKQDLGKLRRVRKQRAAQKLRALVPELQDAARTIEDSTKTLVDIPDEQNNR